MTECPNIEAGCDDCLRKMIEEYDAKVRQDAIYGFQNWLKSQVVGVDNYSKEILVVRDDRWELACELYIEQLKEQK